MIDVTAAGQLLFQRRQLGLAGTLLAESLQPTNAVEAFLVQQQVASLMPSPVIGWKCALSTAAKPVVAPLYQAELQQADTQNPLMPAICQLWPSAEGLARVEPELCYQLKSDLPVRDLAYSAAEIDAAIGPVYLALELIQSRFHSDAAASYFDQLADGLFNQGLWLGPKITGAELAEFSLSVQIEGQPLQRLSAEHPTQAPRPPLYQLVNFLSQQQIPLQAGQLLITGSYAGVLKLPLAQKIIFTFGPLGHFCLQFAAKSTAPAVETLIEATQLAGN